MNSLHQSFLTCLSRRGYTEATIKSYSLGVKQLSLYYGRCPSKISDEELMAYFDYLRDDRRLAQGSINGAYTGIKLFWEISLNREWPAKHLPRSRQPKTLPEVLSREEVRLLIDMTNDRVRFHYRDYADNNRSKVKDLASEEFIRRFLQHVLPAGFCKVRYYGLLAIRNRSRRLQLCHRLLGQRYQPAANKSWIELLIQVTGQDPRQCPD